MTDNRERTTGLLPPDSSTLFLGGELQGHNFAESSFIKDDVGTDVSECDLTNVDTSNVEDMSSMFLSAESFNQDIGNWDTSNVEDMSSMFLRAESFNQDISNWDTSNVEDMSSMFLSAESFDQDLSAWCVKQITQKPHVFDNGAGFDGVNVKHPNWGDKDDAYGSFDEISLPRDKDDAYGSFDEISIPRDEDQLKHENQVETEGFSMWNHDPAIFSLTNHDQSHQEFYRIENPEEFFEGVSGEREMIEKIRESEPSQTVDVPYIDWGFGPVL